MKRLALLALAGFAAPAAAETFFVLPGPDAETQLQEALILAQPGDTVRLGVGEFDMRNGLSLDNDDVTIAGAGMDQTVLSFRNQTGGGEGLLVTGNGAILKDFAIEDTAGDGVKSKGVDGIAMLRMRVEWTRGPNPENGGYAFYPVQSHNVLIDGVVAIGASDSGIYVGQSQDIIVRNSRGEYNVAGLEIENSYRADVNDNILTNNTGGILIFDLPDLPQQGGHDIRVFNNHSFHNATQNFAPEGNIVGIVPTGTGMLIMANHDVEVFGNTFEDNKTVNLVIASYVEETDDPNYNKHPARLHIHDNTFGTGGFEPDTGEFGTIMKDIFGVPIPQIVFDGVMPLARYFTIGSAAGDKHSIHDNINNSDNQLYGNADFIGWFGLPRWLHSMSNNVAEHHAELDPIAPAVVTIRGMDVNDTSVWKE